MQAFTSCKSAIEYCINNNYFAIAHLYNEEKTMDMHIHDCYEIYYSISGGKQFLIDNKCYSIDPGDIFVINQYESHYLSGIDQAVHERIIISIQPDYLKHLSTSKTDLDSCFSHRDNTPCHRINLDENQKQRFIYFIHKITSTTGFGSDLIEEATFIELMVMLNSLFCNISKPDASTTNYQYNQQVGEILEFINHSIHTDITLEGLSKHFFLSKSYLCRIFKAETGTTINKYITARKISIAKSLLATGLNVNEVCEQCGFNDYSNFLKSFTKAV